MGRAFQIIEVPHRKFKVKRYLRHKNEIEKTIKQYMKRDRKREGRINFYENN